MSVVSRFAPAPTGFLHVGHVVNALYVWGVTRALGGQVLLRIEDHDRARSRPAFEAAILEDLAWLGFEADAPMARQSDRHDVYEAALDLLRRQGLVYACDCSRAAIARASSAPGTPQPDGGHEVRYPGTCAEKGLAEGPGVGVRVRLAPSIERFDDWAHGPLEQQPSAQCGDVLVRDRTGDWTYQFAATVDDLRQGVTLVIRGDDLLASTGRQIQLARFLGRDAPTAFLHHPLIMKSASQKLSKSDGDTGVGALRAQGWAREDVLGHAAWRAGLVAAPRPVRPEDAPALVAAYVKTRR